MEPRNSPLQLNSAMIRKDAATIWVYYNDIMILIFIFIFENRFFKKKNVQVAGKNQLRKYIKAENYKTYPGPFSAM